MNINYKVVVVEWMDAQTSIENMTIDEIKEYLTPKMAMSVGFLIHETKKYIVLGFLDFGDGLIKHHQVIPRRN